MSKAAPAASEPLLSVLRDDGSVDPKLDPGLDKAACLELHRNMLRNRALDERGMTLQRQGRIGFYLPSTGEEAAQAGAVSVLRDADWVFPSYRDPGMALWRGATMLQMLANCFGNSGDLCKGRQMPVHYAFPRYVSISSPIGTQIVQAVGMAVGARIQKRKDIALTSFGDGATSSNDFHTGMNFAGVWKAGVIFLCKNNGWAISVPLEKQTASTSIAAKAEAYGMPGVRVDGNDVLAVVRAATEAAARARAGKGPTLIEAVTFRVGPHSSSDDPTRYRDKNLVETWQKRDPIERFKRFLLKAGHVTEKAHATLWEEARAEAAAAAKQAEALPPITISSMFDEVYGQITPELAGQKQALLSELQARGEVENTSQAFPL
jgi:2-oxoisovalerate dehydrogenase E1 component alpha subunit